MGKKKKRKKWEERSVARWAEMEIIGRTEISGDIHPKPLLNTKTVGVRIKGWRGRSLAGTIRWRGGGGRDRAFAGGWRDSDGGATDRHYSTIHSVAQSYVTKAFHLQAHCGNPGDINCRGSLPLSAPETDLSTPPTSLVPWRKPSIQRGGGGGEGRGPRSAISLRITYSAAMRRLCPPAFPTDPPPFRKGFLRLTNTSSEGDASVERDCLLSALLPRPRRILIFRGEPRRGGKKRRRRKEAPFFYRPPCGLARRRD